MIRTRDYVLFLVTVLFLVASISATAVSRVAGTGQTAALSTAFTVPEAGNLTAEVVAAPRIDRSGRVLAMREKIKQRMEQVTPASTASEPVPEEIVTATPDADGETAAATAGEPITCPTHSDATIPSLAGAKFKEVEGARIVYTTTFVEDPVNASGTLSAATEEEVVLLQLPLRTMPLSNPSCIPYDIVGVALDGSVIRNDEASLYAVFGSETLIGYALDGFPLYGRSESTDTDRCGGLLAGGMYRYYLSDEREVVLNCFAGVPITL